MCCYLKNKNTCWCYWATAKVHTLQIIYKNSLIPICRYTKRFPIKTRAILSNKTFTLLKKALNAAYKYFVNVNMYLLFVMYIKIHKKSKHTYILHADRFVHTNKNSYINILFKKGCYRFFLLLLFVYIVSQLLLP